MPAKSWLPAVQRPQHFLYFVPDYRAGGQLEVRCSDPQSSLAVATDTGPIVPHRLTTDRLVLRPTTVLDADRASEIQSNWEVTRMLRRASFPPDREELIRWFADHPREWAVGEAYRFGVELRGKLIGVVDIDEISQREGELGYWLDQANWAQGYASEAAKAMVHFAINDVGLQCLRSGHAADNRASGSVLLKLGFRPLDAVQRMSRPRGEEIIQRRYILTSSNNISDRPECRGGAAVDAVADRVDQLGGHQANEALYDGRAQRARLHPADAPHISG